MNWFIDFNVLFEVKLELMLYFLKWLLVIIYIFIVKLKICQKDSIIIKIF